MKQSNSRGPLARRILAIVLLSGLFIAPVTLVQAQSTADPWDVSWLPHDRHGDRLLDRAIDSLLDDTSLRGQGTAIRVNAQRHGVNPAFALAFFRQEAGFAARGTLAYRNKNPANIVATGKCGDQAPGVRCKGFYGEVSTDGRFGRYASLEDGIEAFFVLMAREYAGLSLHDLIARACPPSECDVPGYVARMEQWISEYQAQLIETLYPEAELQDTALDDRPDIVAPPPARAPRAEAGLSHEPLRQQKPVPADQPVLLARMWSAAQRLFPYCCGSAVLILFLGMLGIVLWSRLPLGLLW